MTAISRLVLSTAMVALVPAMAHAADYDPPIAVEQAPEYVPVEVGSGWYLRGDVAYAINETFADTRLGDPNINRFSEDTFPVSATIGMGYHVTDYFRLEANVGLLAQQNSELEFLVPAAYDGRATTENQMWSGMVSAYGDLGTYAGFTPYIGAGIGLVSAKREYNLNAVPLDPNLPAIDYVDSDRSYSLAYSVGAGVSYQIIPNWSIDLGYQWFMAPDAERVTMTGLDTYAVEEGIDFHQVKVGLRYDLW